jgi:hypothetical protein
MPVRARWPALALIMAGLLAVAGIVALTSQNAPTPTRPAGASPGSPQEEATPAPTPRLVAGWFEPAALDSPLAATWGTLAVDRDFDGRIDLFMGRHRSPPQLFVGRPTALRLGPSPWPHPMDRHGCAWGEANGDGLPDLLCVQGAAHGKGERPNELWIQHPDGSLHERAAAYGVELPPQRKRSVNWIDFDRDGDLDLFIGAYLRAGAPDTMLRNDRGRFTKVRVGLANELNVISSAWSDLDHDGWPDLLAVQSGGPTKLYLNHHGHFHEKPMPALRQTAYLMAAWGDADGDGWSDLALVQSDRIRLLRNDQGTLRRWATLHAHRTRAVAWADFNSDGLADIFAVQGAPGFEQGAVADEPDLVLLQRSDGGFSSFALAETDGWEGAGESVVASDLDFDGRMDVVVANGNHRWDGTDHVLLNRSPNGNAIVFGLRGSRWNPLGFGVRIEVRAGSISRTVWLADGVAGSVQSAGQVHLGLGSAMSARIVIRWPDGARECLAGAPGDWGLIHRGSNPCQRR